MGGCQVGFGRGLGVTVTGLGGAEVELVGGGGWCGWMLGRVWAGTGCD